MIAFLWLCVATYCSMSLAYTVWSPSSPFSGTGSPSTAVHGGKGGRFRKLSSQGMDRHSRVREASLSWRRKYLALKSTMATPTSSSATAAASSASRPFSTAMGATTTSTTTTVASQTHEAFPWTQSIHATRDLTYMPLFQLQLDLIQQYLGMSTMSLPLHFIQQQSNVKPARIANLCFQNAYFRKVRMTYFDAGDSVQVFNTLWYPHYQYDLPLFGVDLISLGKGRVLNVIDFQPLHPTSDYAAKYVNHLSTIKQKYPDLHGTLSGKIYNDTSFFSSQMLFGRFTDESKISSVVLPAFQEYLTSYVEMMQQATPNYDPDFQEMVKTRQAAYDAYSALKDPAVGLFDAYFGKEWSHTFVHDFLFSLSQSKTESNASSGTATAGEGSSECNNSEFGPVHSFKLDSETGMISSVSNSNHQH